MNLGAALRVGLAAGLVAGAIWGLFIVFAIGPLIDEAESYEEEPNPVPVLERRLVALGGVLVLGLLIGLGFSLVLRVWSMVLPGENRLAKALALGLLAFLVFGLLPILNIPSNPPGVETNLSAEERGFWFVATIAAAFGGIMAAGGLYYLASPQFKSVGGRRVLAIGALTMAIVLATFPFLLRPSLEREPSLIPSSLIDAFFYLTIVQWLVFWVALALLVGFLSARMEPMGTAAEPV